MLPGAEGQNMGNPKESRSNEVANMPRRIIVSIDFGTTYSGVAWAETSRVRPHTSALMEGRLHALTFVARCAACRVDLAIDELLQEQRQSPD